MKLVQEGLADVTSQIRIKCDVCEAIFDVSAEDIEKTEGIRRYYTTCPNAKCKSSIEIQESSITSDMLHKIDYRET